MHIIRIAKNDDIPGIKAIDHLIERDPARACAIDAATGRGDCIVLEVKSRIAGYGIVKPDFFGHFLIEMVYLADNCRGQGYGLEMLATMQQKATTDRIFTSCNHSNTRMQHVLEREGWCYSGFINNLDPGDPEIIYCRFV
jgi:ribosomal protein S18 acetylase RimI-like enzyme